MIRPTMAAWMMTASAAAWCAGAPQEPMATTSPSPGDPALLQVSLAPSEGQFYEQRDLSVKLVFENPGREAVMVDAAAFARERFSLADAKGRAPRPAAGGPADAADPLRVEGQGTAERVVNLSSWYEDLARREGVWDVRWSHGNLSAVLKARVIRAYVAHRDVKAIVETDLGRMVWTLLPAHAPVHVKRFVDLARQGFYSGLNIYRVVPGMQAEGGDPAGDGSGVFRRVIPGELSPDLKLEDMGMIGAQRPETSMTSDSAFFITLGPNDFMRGRQTFFAKVTDGLEVVAKLVQVPRRGDTAMDPYLLVTPVTIREVRIP